MGFVCKSQQVFLSGKPDLESLLFGRRSMNLAIVLCDIFNTLSVASLDWEISVQDQLSAEAWCACEVALVHLTHEIIFFWYCDETGKILRIVSTRTV